ncbi:MAG: PD-(D/E)XK nuclease family protein [Acidobacteriaceae bacterium]
MQISESGLFLRLEDTVQAPLVLTGSQRAARTLLQHYGQWQKKNKRAGWYTPRIMTWDTWLKGLWDTLLLTGGTQQALMSTAQECYLWKEVLSHAKDAGIGPIGDPGPLAELAQASLLLLEEHCISIAQVQQVAAGTDTRTFLRWLHAFQAQCDRRGLLPQSALARALTEKLGQIHSSLPQDILLLGLDRVTPGQQKTIQELENLGVRVSFVLLVPEKHEDTSPMLVAATTIEEELFSAACWARRLLQQDPGQRIGILAPSVMETRDKIERIFRRVLAPSILDVNATYLRPTYEFSLGTPIGKLPQVRAALLLIRWLTQPIDFDDASSLIVSGHVGGGTVDSRARLDAALRIDPQCLGGSLEFSWLLRMGRKKNTLDVGAFLQNMDDVASLAEKQSVFATGNQVKKTCSHAEWCEVVRGLLKAANWSLLQARSSAEFQLLERWENVLDEVSSLDAISSTVPFWDMLEALEGAASSTLYIKETQDAPVQIMGVPESSGLTFDAVWFINASTNRWPAPGRPNPWVPWTIQREAGMPHASAQVDYNYACNMTQRAIAASGKTVFSFPMEDAAIETNAARRPQMAVRISPVIQDLLPSVAPVAAREWVPEIGVSMWSRHANETVPVSSEMNVPFTAQKIQSGASFLKQQAACPYKAFVELRLSATTPRPFAVGITASNQGKIIHEILRGLWEKMKDRETLHALTMGQRLDALEGHIQDSLSKLSACGPFDRALLITEAEKLRKRLLDWLDIEEQRPDFTVLACEYTLKDGFIGDIQVDCRIDRIDNVVEGTVLIDYKTGTTVVSACDGERPDEPQLPAYAVLMRNQAAFDRPLIGVAIGSLQAKSLGFKVVYSLPQVFERKEANGPRSRTSILKTKSGFMERVDIWEDTLQHLAKDFCAGVASVDPKSPGITCAYCDQRILCRVAETQVSTQDEHDEDNGEYEGIGWGSTGKLDGNLYTDNA